MVYIMSTVKTDAIETAAGGTSVLTLGTSTQTLKILGGTPGADKVLTSDATGGTTWGVAAVSGIAASEMKGFRVRPMFSRNSATQMRLNGTFVYQHAGTTAQILTGADVTFTRSDTSGTAQFNYLYIDDSAVVTAGNTIITATELISSPTAPTLNTTKGGFYNGNDRCIYAFKQDASNDIYRESSMSPIGNPGTVRTDYTNQFVNESGTGYGTGWHSYTFSADYLPRPCGPAGLAIAQYVNLGGGHSTIHIAAPTANYDMFGVNAPWFANAPVTTSGVASFRSDYAHSSYTHVFYTRGWVMNPLL